MMMKRSIFQSSGIGAINLLKRFVLALLTLLLLMIPAANALGEEDTCIMLRYQLDEFMSFFKITHETKSVDVIYHTIAVIDLRKCNISEQSLLEEFPDYSVIREHIPDEESNLEKYVTYNLTDDSILYIFIEKGILTNVYHMVPRCSAREFNLIMQGISTPNDVVSIDENTVFNPFIQWGPVSYHCLDDGTFRQVTYEQSESSSSGFIVKSITIISQNECLSILRYICPDDMPLKR